MNGHFANVIHVEVLLQENCLESKEVIERHCSKILLGMPNPQEDVMIATLDDIYVKTIVLNVQNPTGIGNNINLNSNPYFVYHIYQTHSDGPCEFDLGGEDAQGASAATHWCLPSSDFVGLWENLIFDSKIKHQLLKYVASTLYFSQKQVNFNIIPWNKVVLLHGPPGTGKTSLCKALAQKICIQFSNKFTYGNLLEINCHSLFSKWFSESGKLVSAMFRRIEEVIRDESSLVIILIDEVESLAHSRKAAFSGNSEPSDSIRVVNALLTHLDAIKRYPNVLIFTTSNITEAIDLALVDRADIKQYIGLPSADAIYQMFYSCITELQRTGIVMNDFQLLSLPELKTHNMSDSLSLAYSSTLYNISKNTVGLSGRTVRKLSVLAYAMHIQNEVVSMEEFLKALDATVREKQKNEVSSENVNLVNKMVGSIAI